jgi:hypothetical protein
MPEITNPLDAAIAHLEQQKAEIDALIQSIKRFRDSGGLPSVPVGQQLLATGNAVDLDSIPSDAFFGLTIVDAAIKYLHMVGRKPQSTNAIIEAFERGALKGKNYSTVYGVLNRRAKTEGDIVNVHGDWGLQEWYGSAKKRAAIPIPKRGASLNPDDFADEEEEQQSEDKTAVK